MRPACRSLCRLLSFLSILLFCSGSDAAEQASPNPELKSPLAPADAVKHFRLPGGLRMELVAVEPQIESPVAMAFDEEGKLWVVEMLDYPNGPKAGEKPAGRIKVLEDRDGDGSYETGRIFADGLLYANGLLPWKGGLLVTAAPHIVYLKDTDGDGKADHKEILYEGFATQNPQLRVSHPVLGPDGWVYVVNGLRGGKARAAGKPDAPVVDLGGRDFRFHLLTGQYEAISGLGQYGNTFDDWGQRFVCDNRHHLRHVVIEGRYLQRNPFLAVPEVVQDISVLEDGPLSSGGKIYPLSKNWTTSSLHVGRFTAACGVMIYRGDLLPLEYRGAYTCDPTGNLVHQEILEPHGATFRSRPAKAGVEFLATPDEWFRPVFLSHGPDGALYVVDMYRAVIEHPEFMPTELKNRPDLTLGKERGRIWRIVPEKHTTRALRPNLSGATVETLNGHLANPNPWYRMTAQRLLLDRPAANVAAWLRVTASAGRSPHQRLHALGLLETIAPFNSSEWETFFGTERDPRVLAFAVRLAERRLKEHPGLARTLVGLLLDSDPALRFQIACSLGEASDPNLESLARIATGGAEDRWTRLAVASAVPNRAGALLALLLQPPHAGRKASSPGLESLIQELAALVGARRDTTEVAVVLEALSTYEGPDAGRWQRAGLTGLGQGLGRRGDQMATFLKTLPNDGRNLPARAEKLLKQAATDAVNPKLPVADRLRAVPLMAHATWETAGPVLTPLLASEPTQEIRLAAVRAAAAHSRPEVAALLVKDWRSYTPGMRREVMEAMLRQPERTVVLLNEVEATRIRAADLDSVRTRQLTNHARADIRDRARKLLQGNLPADRKKVMADYQAALTLKGDPKQGQAIFQKNCATCHRVGAIGVDVGPDIADTRTKTPEQLLLDILNPNAAIDSNFVNYEVSLKNGRVLTGLIATETATSVTLRRAENQTDLVLRQDIEEIRSTGVSLMPDGVEKTIPVRDMADLVSFLKNWRYLDGRVPLEGEGRKGGSSPPGSER